MEAARDPVLAALRVGERLIWRQRAPSRRIAASHGFPIVFLIVWCGLTGFSSFDFARSAASGIREYGFDLMSGLTTLAALVLGLILLFGLRELWFHSVGLVDSGLTHYALTSRRLLIASPHRLIAYGRAEVARMEVTGCDILFNWGKISRRRRRSEGFRAQLLDIADAASVAELITKTLATAKPN